jgi:hypothetical protein
MADQTNISKAQKLLEEMNAKYGATPSAPAQQPTQPPQQQVQPPQQRGLVNDAMSLIKGRQQQIDKASGYAGGGKVKAHASGAKIKTIKGPGTSTSDSIPAKVKETGEKILVSNDERILSKKQDKLLEKIAKMLGYETTDELLASGTGRPVGPTMKDGKKAAALGWNNDVEDEYTNALKSEAVAPIVPAGETPRQQKDFSGEFLGDLKNWMASKTPVASEEEAAKLRGVDDPFIVGPGAVSRTMMRQAGNALVHEPLVENKQQGSAGRKLTLPENPAMSPNPSGVLAKLTGSYPTSTTENYVEQNQATSPLITGRNDKGVITADSAQSAYGNDMGRSGKVFGTYDGKGVNDILARENAAREGIINSMINANGPAGAGFAALPDNATLPGGGSVADWNNTVGMSAEDKAKYTLARQGVDNGRYSTDVQAQRAAGHDQMLMRGQDMQAQSEAARLAGNPMDNRIKGAQVSSLEELAKLRGNLLNAKTPEEQAKATALLRAYSGGANKEAHQTAHVVGVYDGMGNKIGERLAVAPSGGEPSFYDPSGKNAGQQKRPYADFEKAYLAQRPGTSAAQIKADYEAYAKG